MKEALFYEKLEANKVKCRLCPWDCIIVSGKVGVCGVRRNIDGQLTAENYAQVSSIAIDPIEKKPLYHFHPGSAVLSLGCYGCNLHCGHCQNWQIAHKHSGPTEYIPPEKLVELAKENNCQGIAWTYNEPTIWFEYALKGAKLAKKAGLYTVFVTNGYINPEPLDMIGPYLDAYSVDIKGFSDQIYKKLAKINGFKPILEATVRAKKKWNMHVEVTTLVIPTINDDEAQLKNIAKWIVEELGPETPWHVSRFHPCLDYQHLPPTPVETLKMAKEIGLKAGLKYVHIGNVAGMD
ncbi:MAG: AmmeMemoRadiSam system radical SAM enzyme [bacterium]